MAGEARPSAIDRVTPVFLGVFGGVGLGTLPTILTALALGLALSLSDHGLSVVVEISWPIYAVVIGAALFRSERRFNKLMDDYG